MPQPDHYAEWLSDARLISVSVNCEAGQTELACRQDFEAAVAAVKALFPEDE